jgi:aminotransferase
MTIKLSKRVEVVKFSPIREIFDLASKTPGLTRLEVGQPDFKTPQYIRESSKSIIDGGFISYTPTSGLQETREAISNKLKEDYDLNYDPNREIAVTIGASGALYLSLRALLNVGDEVLRPDPGFASYDEIIKDADGIPKKYPLIPDRKFAIDFEALEELITEKTKALIVNSPGNPVGNIIDEKQLIKLVELAEKYDFIILSDEAYDKVIFDYEHLPTAKVAKDKSRVLMIGSSSKNYAMTGYRVGYAAGDAKLVAEIVKFQSLSSICPSFIGQRAYAAALNGPQDDTLAMKNEYQKRRDYFVEQLNQINGFKCQKPDGAFYAFVDISEITEDDWAFSKLLISEAKVTSIPGSSFGDVGKGYLRFSFATSMEILEEGIKKLKDYLNK